jgi:LysM repeat protein
MKKLVILFLLVVSSIIAQETTHTVKVDDTLWDIAQMYYSNPFLWPYIWRANLSKIQDPHWIYPDQVFVIPPSPESAGTAPAYVPPVTPYVSTPVKKTAEVVSVVKSEEHVFSEALLHRAGFIVTENMPVWGRILQTEPAGEKMISTYKTVYIDRVEDIKAGDVLSIYRPGKNYDDPKTGRFLGKEIIVLGKLEVSELGKDGARCKVISSYDIIQNGDRIMPYEPLVAPEDVQLIPATKELEGYVVDVKGQESNITPPHLFTVVNQGEESGVVVGDIFDVYQERVIDGKKMPDFNTAKIQIVAVFQNASIGLLLWVRETVQVVRGEKCRLVQEAR